jgi:hypothetical protein
MKKGFFMFWVNEGLTPQHFVDACGFDITPKWDAMYLTLCFTPPGPP